MADPRSMTLDGLTRPWWRRIWRRRPRGGLHEFGLADTQEEIALLFRTTQQSVSRWMRNPAPVLGSADG